jgi:hypothetical protein
MYYTLGIPIKIPERGLRLIYLKDVWGLPQSLVGECEGLSQTRVSIRLKEAREKYKGVDIKAEIDIKFTPKEIKALQDYPNDVLTDVQLVSFVEHVLEIEVNHLFYQMMNQNKGFRMSALASLGMQQNHVSRIFKKIPSTISLLMAKRGERANGSLLNSVLRTKMDREPVIKHLYEKPVPKFFIASQQHIEKGKQ